MAGERDAAWVLVEQMAVKMDVIGEQVSLIPEMRRDISEIKTVLDSHTTDLQVLKVTAASHSKDLLILKSDVAVLKSDVAVLKSDVAVLKSDVSEMKGTLKGHDRLLVELTTASHTH